MNLWERGIGGGQGLVGLLIWMAPGSPFCSAHQLVEHKGKCANLHGHTYILEVMVKGETKCEQHGSDAGFVAGHSKMQVCHFMLSGFMEHQQAGLK